MNPKVSIELDTSQWWAIVYALRGEDLGGHQPSLANHLVRAITKPCNKPSLQEVLTEANELMDEANGALEEALVELEAL